MAGPKFHSKGNLGGGGGAGGRVRITVTGTGEPRPPSVHKLPEGYYASPRQLAFGLLGMPRQAIEAIQLGSLVEFVSRMLEAGVVCWVPLSDRSLYEGQLRLADGVTLEHASAGARAIWLGMQGGDG